MHIANDHSNGCKARLISDPTVTGVIVRTKIFGVTSMILKMADNTHKIYFGNSCMMFECYECNCPHPM